MVQQGDALFDIANKVRWGGAQLCAGWWRTHHTHLRGASGWLAALRRILSRGAASSHQLSSSHQSVAHSPPLPCCSLCATLPTLPARSST